MKKEKEILYLNTNLVNSLLSQHNGGLIAGVNTETSTDKKMKKETRVGGKNSATVGAEASAGLGKILSKFNATVDGEFTGEMNGDRTRGKELSEGQKDIINKTFHDYSLNILLNDLDTIIKKEISKTEIGDLVHLYTESQLFDFELLSDLVKASNKNGVTEMEEIEQEIEKFKLTHHLNYENIEKMFKLDELELDYNDSQKKYYEKHSDLIENYRELYNELNTEKRGFQNINILHDYLDNISLLSTDTSLSLMEKNYLYEPSNIMSFRVNDHKEINIVGRIINITDENFGEIEDNLSTLPLRMVERLLKMLDLIATGTRIIEPIAIYY